MKGGGREAEGEKRKAWRVSSELQWVIRKDIRRYDRWWISIHLVNPGEKGDSRDVDVFLMKRDGGEQAQEHMEQHSVLLAHLLVCDCVTCYEIYPVETCSPQSSRNRRENIGVWSIVEPVRLSCEIQWRLDVKGTECDLGCLGDLRLISPAAQNNRLLRYSAGRWKRNLCKHRARPRRNFTSRVERSGRCISPNFTTMNSWDIWKFLYGDVEFHALKCVTSASHSEKKKVEGKGENCWLP